MYPDLGGYWGGNDGGDLLRTSSSIPFANPLGVPVPDGRDAAIQGLIAMMTGIGAASGSSPTPRGPGVVLAAGANAGLRANREAEELQIIKEYRDAQRQKLAAELPLTRAKASLFQGVAGGTGGDLLTDTPENRLRFGLLGITPPFKDPTIRDLNVNGLPTPHQLVGGKWEPISGPQAPSGYALTPEGSLAPMAGGPADPRTIEQRAGAEARGGMPYKPLAVEKGGRLIYPDASMAGGSAGMPSPAAAPAGQGDPMQPRVDYVPGVGRVVSMPDQEIDKAGVAKVQEQLVEMTGQMQQTAAIQQRFKPEFQTLWERWKQAGTALKDKLGWPTDPQARESLTAFTNFRAEAGQFFADRMKAMSGAAVTPEEAKRQEQYLPKTGQGAFDGDSPTEFKAKVDRMEDFFRNTTARLSYINNNKGLTIKDVPLERMPSIIQKRGDELAKDLSMRGLKGDELKAAVRQRLGSEFGLLQ